MVPKSELEKLEKELLNWNRALIEVEDEMNKTEETFENGGTNDYFTFRYDLLLDMKINCKEHIKKCKKKIEEIKESENK